MLLSVIIPSYKDKLMPKTVRSLLDNSELGDEMEIVVVLDGYEPDFRLVEDPRVRYIRQENTGMRGAINRAVKESRGEYLMRTDEHCMFGQGFDRILLESMQDNWIMTLKRYYLDTVEWTVMDKPPMECERLIIDKDRHKFAGVRCRKKSPDDIFEVTAMQGSMWCMKRSWWDSVIGELQTEGYGPLYQDSVEMSFKTWKAGGKLMMNHQCWYAHKDRSFSRTHNINREESQVSFDYARETWQDYFKELKEQWKSNSQLCS